MMRMEMRPVQLPRWTVPVLILFALALIPFALVLALAAAGIAVAASAFRLLTGGRVGPTGLKPRSGTSRVVFPDHQAIDADFKVKDER